jgi:hypothetical protein
MTRSPEPGGTAPADVARFFVNVLRVRAKTHDAFFVPAMTQPEKMPQFVYGLFDGPFFENTLVTSLAGEFGMQPE